MKQKSVAALVALACLFAGHTSALEQPPADCTPNALNIPGAPYPCIFPDKRVAFRVSAPDAQKVRVRLGQGFDMSKASRRPVARHDHPAGRGLPLLHAVKSMAP